MCTLKHIRFVNLTTITASLRQKNLIASFHFFWQGGGGWVESRRDHVLIIPISFVLYNITNEVIFFSSDVVGRISSQLSIISATIQSITKTWNEAQLTNQLIEINVSNLEKTSNEPVCHFF